MKTLLLIGLVLLCACSGSHRVDIENVGDLTIRYTESWEVRHEEGLYVGSPRHKLLMEWIVENKESWEPYVATTAPGKVIVFNDRMSLNVGDDWVVLNYQNEGKVSQFRKETAKNELDFLLQKP